MSTSPTPSPEPVPVKPPPSRPVLDDKKKAKIVALLSVGISRRMAARYVCCAPSTIMRTAARDPQFRQQLTVAEQNTDIAALRAVRNAAAKPRYWRAAAWLLERRNPDDFAPRKPETYTTGELASFLACVMEDLYEDLPKENYQRIVKKLDQLHEMSKKDVRADRAAPFQMPDFDKQWADADRREAEQRKLSHDDDGNSVPDGLYDKSAISPRPLGEGPG